MITGTGIDILLISRMAKSMEKETFLRKVFTEAERDYIQSKGNGAQSAAGIFCAKEAYLKAMGKGIGSIPLHEIEVLHKKSGAPYIGCKDKKIHLSISHMGDIAIAQVIIESEDTICE